MPITLFLQSFSYTPVSSSLNPTSNSTNNINNKTTSKNVQTPSLPPTNKTTQLTVSSPDPISQSNPTIRIPTPPWMRGPLLLQPHELLNLTKPNNKNTSSKNANNNNNNIAKTDKALTAKEGIRGDKAMKNIVKSVERLQKIQTLVSTHESFEELEIGEGLKQIGGGDGELGSDTKLPWVREDNLLYWRMQKEKVVTKAQLSLDKELLERLRAEAAKMRKWVKVKKAGVTQEKVDEIRYAWRRNELAMVKFDLPLCRNMDRAREIVEMKTGGLVVWTKKHTHVIYRGCNYKLMKNSHVHTMDENNCTKDGENESMPTSIFVVEDVNTQPINGSLFERETDRLLDGLGPRYVDWWMRKPLPVDGDLLPEVVTGFRRPSRLCPSHARPQLKDDELTYLRKLAFGLPSHFVLGRNRKLQGLAAAILKLWEKSHIAKIAVKWGIPNTDNEQMANELKSLTGGVLLLRNKFFIILYRGKDFLPCQVANVIADRENKLKRCQLNEESARMTATGTFSVADEPLANTSKVGTLYEFQDIQIKFGELAKGIGESELQLEAEKEKLERELKMQEHKHSILKKKIGKSATKLSKLSAAWAPAEKDTDQGIMTEEERECFRKIGLKMHSSLLLGRRGVFDGVIEGLHQHWKFREVIKVITMQRVFAQVIYTAKLLEAESGGILVSVDKLKEGYAIIIYRGKNYRRPPKLLKTNLLTKRKALLKSLEMQRIGSLKFFAYQRERAISEIKSKMANLQESKDKESEKITYCDQTDVSLSDSA